MWIEEKGGKVNLAALFHEQAKASETKVIRTLGAMRMTDSPTR
ncbi:hypothetical protein [Paraburkholderia aromaticivorans]